METPSVPGGSGLSRIPRSTPRPISVDKSEEGKTPVFKQPKAPSFKASTLQQKKVTTTPRGVPTTNKGRKSLGRKSAHSTAFNATNGLKRAAPSASTNAIVTKRTRVLTESNKANAGTKRVLNRVTGSSAKTGTCTESTSAKTGAQSEAEKKRKVQPWDIKGKLEVAQEINKKLKDELEIANERLSELQGKTELVQSLEKENHELKTKLRDKQDLIVDFKNEIDALQMKNVKLDKVVADLGQKLEEQIRVNKEQAEQITKLNDLRKEMHNQIQDLKGNIRVFCRVRPPTSTESERKMHLCNIVYPDTTSLEITKAKDDVTGKSRNCKQDFVFDRVFSASASQIDIYQELEQLVQSSLDGYNVCVLAYGQTGSGKTYTMDGQDDTENRGMIPRTVDTLFEKISSLRSLGWQYTVQCFFIEIYNEQIRDLLNYHSPLPHEIRMVENKKNEVQVTNLSVETVESKHDLNNLIAVARKNRYVAATACNEHSSRSHFIMKVALNGINVERDMSCSGSICLVDLAGSEKFHDQNLSDRKKETLNINKSLSSLANVILSLQQKQEHIPYRNSKLTHLLMPCLGGTSKTLMIVNISPVEECYNESLNSLRFATRVNQCHVVAKKFLRSA